MSPLRTQLQSAADAYAKATYPGDLAEDASARIELDAARPDYVSANYPGDLAADVRAREAIEAAELDYAKAKYPGDLAADVRKRNTLTYQPAAGNSRWIARSLSIAAALALVLGGGIVALREYRQPLSSAYSMLSPAKTVPGVQSPAAVNAVPQKSADSSESTDRLPQMTDVLAALDTPEETGATDTNTDSPDTSANTASPTLNVITAPTDMTASLPSVPSFPSFDASDSTIEVKG